MMAHATQQEEDLVRRVQHGDESAFDRLVQLCAPRVYHLAYRLVGNPDDAQDLAQEAFLRLYQGIPRFKGESAFATWLYRIVANVCYDELKRRRRRSPPVTDLTPADAETDILDTLTDGESAQDVLERRERQRVVQRAITTLPEHYRLVLVLYDLRGLSYEEIAVALRMNVGTVKSRLNRARNLLREKLQAERELLEIGGSQTE